MISVILYGRNDSYGYNLHKRAALSFNCIAELLDDPDDEILFVDYNTPDDFPTFPEAIRDTLTPRARRLLRILRVRPRHHRRFAHLSHLVALEPVARNVAARRASPANRWLLSTNTDMIFVPRTGRSLSALAAPLPDGYVHLARLEIPESLWETLDRLDPAGTIATVADWGWRFHLNEITAHALPYLRFDAPGDFQLMLREDVHRLHGFDERMLLGYHVDSNIARRLHLLHGTCGDLQDDLFGYHCDHTRQVTPAHRHDAVENDVARFVFNLDTPHAAHQAGTWGLAGEDIEEVRLDGGRPTYRAVLERAIDTPMAAPTTSLLADEWIERLDYDPRHALPFLLDALAEYPRDTVLGWFGTRADTLALFAGAWRDLGFTAPILRPDDAPWLGAPEGTVAAATPAIVRDAHLFVLDGGIPADMPSDTIAPFTPQMRHVVRALGRITAAERLLQKLRATAAALPEHHRTPRRVVGLNGFLNTWELQFAAAIGAAKSPGATRVRQGFVLPAPNGPLPQSVLTPGPCGEPIGRLIRLAPRRGLVLLARQIGLPPGDWMFEAALAPPGGRPRPGPLKLDVLRGDTPVAMRLLVATGLIAQRLRIAFTLPDDGHDGEEIILRLRTIGLAGGVVTGLRLLRRGN